MNGSNIHIVTGRRQSLHAVIELFFQCTTHASTACPLCSERWALLALTINSVLILKTPQYVICDHRIARNNYGIGDHRADRNVMNANAVTHVFESAQSMRHCASFAVTAHARSRREHRCSRHALPRFGLVVDQGNEMPIGGDGAVHSGALPPLLARRRRDAPDTTRGETHHAMPLSPWVRSVRRDQRRT